MADYRMKIYTASVAGTTTESNKNESDETITWEAGDRIQIVNNGRTVLHMSKTGSNGTYSAITVFTVKGLAVEDPDIVVSAADKVFGPFDRDLYNDADGVLTIATGASDISGLDVRAVDAGV